MTHFALDRAVSQDDTLGTGSVFGTADHQQGRSLVRMSGKRFLGLAALIAGIYAALSPIWTNNPTDTNKGTYTMIALGVVTAALALASLYRPGVVATDSLIALMGVLFVVSPWVMSFSTTAYRPMAWTAWVVGLVALVAGAAEFQLDRSEHGAHGIVTH